MMLSLIQILNFKNVSNLKHLMINDNSVNHDLKKLWTYHVHFLHFYDDIYWMNSTLICYTDLFDSASKDDFMIKETSNSHYQEKDLFSINKLSWLVDSWDVNKLMFIIAVSEIVFESHELATEYLNDSKKIIKTFINSSV